MISVPHAAHAPLRSVCLAITALMALGSVGMAGKAEGMTQYQRGQYGVALYELEGVALQGDREASLLVGLMYLRGQGTEKNFEKAVYWLQEASRLGSAEAYGHLAEMYLAGTELPQSDQDAFYNADTAAKEGYVPAQLLLGKLYLEGRGIEQDASQAREWFTQAAAAGEAEAQYRLGQLSETGEGGNKDLSAALRWYKAAADKGYKAAAEALQRLGSPAAPAPVAVAPVVKPQTPGPAPRPPATPTITQKRRIALLIANQDYQQPIADLRGPGNDVNLLAKVLKDAGFQVISKTNLGLADMKREVTRFLDSVDGNTVSLLYYSGHGIEIEGKNYLLPTDLKMTPGMTANEAQELNFDLAATYARMTAKAEGSLNITILDACRDNPFKTSGVKGIGRTSGGLKGVDIPAGNGDSAIETFTAYAAESGQQAQDAGITQSNSPYAIALAEQIPVPGQVLEATFRKVREQVIRATLSAQKPMSYAGLTSEFFFTPKK